MEITPDSTIEIFRTSDGEVSILSIRAGLQLRLKNLYIGEDKIFNIFGHGGHTHTGYVEYNKVDITAKGRELFQVPEEWTSHLTKIRITPC